MIYKINFFYNETTISKNKNNFVVVDLKTNLKNLFIYNLTMYIIFNNINIVAN